MNSRIVLNTFAGERNVKSDGEGCVGKIGIIVAALMKVMLFT